MSYELVKEARMADPSMEGASDDDVANYLYDVDPSNKKVGSLDEYKNYLGIRKTTPEVKALMGKKVDVGNKLLEPSWIGDKPGKEVIAGMSMISDLPAMAGAAISSGIPDQWMGAPKGSVEAFDERMHDLSQVSGSGLVERISGAKMPNLDDTMVNKIMGFIAEAPGKVTENLGGGEGLKRKVDLATRNIFGLAPLLGVKGRARTTAEAKGPATIATE